MAKQKDAKGFMKDMEKEILQQIEVQLNQLVKETIDDLTFGNQGKQLVIY